MTLAFTLIGLFALGVLLNAFFAGYETGFVASNPIRVRHLADHERNPRALRLLAYMEQPDRMIAVVLIGTNLALVMGTLALTRQTGAFWATLVATPMFLILGEVVPKSMFRAHPTRFALAFMPAIRTFDVLLSPIAVPVTWISRSFLAIVNAEQHEIRSMLNTSDDVRNLVDESADHGHIDAEEQEMIHSVMDLHTRHAREAMIPRIRIHALPESATRKELVDKLRETGHTRIPIFREDIDQVIGVVSAFSVLTDENKDEQDITRFINPILHVPDSIRLDDLLEEMRKNHTRMAIVTDEYGGTDGIITVEDILEEIFGEFHDEHDTEEERIKQVAPGTWLVDARLALAEANELMNTSITDDEVETVGGWVNHLAGRIPSVGEVIESPPYTIRVVDADPHYVGRIQLDVEPEATTEPQSD